MCFWPAFKTRGFYYTTEMYDNMTYGLENLLDKSVMNSPKTDIKFINVTEIKTSSFGKCFTLKIIKPLSLHEDFILILNRTSWDLQVFIHNEGEEFWLAWPPYGLLTNVFRLKIHSDPDASMTSLKVTEKYVKIYPKKTRPCNKTGSGDDRAAILRDAAYHRYFLQH